MKHGRNCVGKFWVCNFWTSNPVPNPLPSNAHANQMSQTWHRTERIGLLHIKLHYGSRMDFSTYLRIYAFLFVFICRNTHMWARLLFICLHITIRMSQFPQGEILFFILIWCIVALTIRMCSICILSFCML